MAITAPPGRSRDSESVKCSEFSAPDIGPGQAVAFYQPGQHPKVALVHEIAGDGSLTLLVLLPDSGNRRRPGVLHRDDPRLTDRRMGTCGYWTLPEPEERRRKQWSELLGKFDQLFSEVAALKKGKRGSDRNE